jgi:integral membrane protein
MSLTRSFRILGYLEGSSLIILLFIAMPLKYVWGDPSAVKIVGMAHGLLFIAYCFGAFHIKDELNWPNRKLFEAWILSCLPFGTFIFDRRSF